MPYPEGFIVSTSFENLIEGLSVPCGSEWSFILKRSTWWTKRSKSAQYRRTSGHQEELARCAKLYIGQHGAFQYGKTSSILGYKPIRDGQYIDDQILYGDPAWVKQIRRAKRELSEATSPESID